MTTAVKLYVLEGLSTDVILGMDFLQRYNPSISWIDACVAMPCLATNGCVCKSSANCVGGAQRVSHSEDVTKCSNGVLCRD